MCQDVEAWCEGSSQSWFKESSNILEIPIHGILTVYPLPTQKKFKDNFLYNCVEKRMKDDIRNLSKKISLTKKMYVKAL